MLTNNIFGYDFICEGTYAELSESMMRFVSDPNNGFSNVITPNAHGINSYFKYAELNRFCKKSKFILPDGQPIVWLSSIRGNKIKNRLTGSDLFPVLFDKLKKKRLALGFIVSDAVIAKKLEADYDLNKTYIPPIFSLEDVEEISRFSNFMSDEIIKHQFQFIFIGISEPKQGALAKAITELLIQKGYTNSCLFLFLGASYQFYFGLIKRAPDFYRKNGLEWFYRLITEPGRMYKRYIFGNLNFVFKAIMWIVQPKYFEKH